MVKAPIIKPKSQLRNSMIATWPVLFIKLANRKEYLKLWNQISFYLSAGQERRGTLNPITPRLRRITKTITRINPIINPAIK